MFNLKLCQHSLNIGEGPDEKRQLCTFSRKAVDKVYTDPFH